MAKRKARCKECSHLSGWDLRCLHVRAPKPNMVIFDLVAEGKAPEWCPLTPTPQEGGR
jgi:hypothetical protein